MKHIQTRFILLAMFVLSPLFLGAQTAAESEMDTLISANDPLVQVAYRKVAQSNLLGGISVVDMEELTKKNYDTYGLENVEAYIGGWSGNTMWGMDGMLVLVDGVPRDANNVVPTEIDQITFLKGASAVVLYGSRAAKGVVYITTKRGNNEGLSVNVRANTGYHVSKSYPKYLGSAEYMSLYNQARANDGLTPSYSDEDIYNYASGSNPYRYSDVDFYSSDYLKKYFNHTDVTTELSGGNDRAQFYSNVGYYNQGDVFKIGEAKNNNVSRLNIRGNVDVKINDFITAFVNANATFYDAKDGNVTDRDDEDDITDDYWTLAAWMRPNRVTPLIPLSYLDTNNFNSNSLIDASNNIIDGQYFLGGSQIDQTNVFADLYAAGSRKYTSRQFQFDTGLNFDLGSVLKGLSFNTQFAVDYATTYVSSYLNKYAVYAPTWYNYNGTDVIGGLTKYGNDEKSGQQNILGSTSRQTIAFSGTFNYKTSINDVHNISAMLIASGFQQTNTTVYHRPSNANLGLQLGYDFSGKYFADFGAALIHSAKLPEGNRNALSPSLTLGWKLSKEGFMANSSVFDELVLSASGSILNTDLDISDFSMYQENYTQSNGAWWGWNDGASERSTNILRGANEDLTFVKRKEISANVRASMWKQLLNVDASVFVNTMEGLIIEPSTTFPEYFFTYYPDASFIPNVNFNNNQRMGFDFNVKLNKRLGEVDLSLGVGGTYYTTEATKRDENFADAYRNRTGRAIDGVWGLQSEGFFQDATDVANSPVQKFGGTVTPGDLKYKDQNGDNVIDEKDEVFLGAGGWYGAPFTMGVNLTAKWKNLTFFAVGTGQFGAYAMKNDSYQWVYGDRKYSEVVRGAWTEATKATATYPRLTTTNGANNFRNSDFWLYKTDRFNIAKIQITYDLPKSLLENFFIHEISTYVSGSNLLTISKEREILEMNINNSPQTRFYNFGVKAVF